MTRRKWQQPIVTSLDRLDPVYGVCDVGATPVANDPNKQCQAGGGASTGVCAFGTGASSGQCLDGSGAKVQCTAGNSR
ncbi:MAG: hypothetical protein RQ723_07520 [Desulfuromonadales bacterium]|nr:hypothetical protein [Desulfuromonadales bacterium]